LLMCGSRHSVRGPLYALCGMPAKPVQCLFHASRTGRLSCAVHQSAGAWARPIQGELGESVRGATSGCAGRDRPKTEILSVEPWSRVADQAVTPRGRRGPQAVCPKPSRGARTAPLSQPLGKPVLDPLSATSHYSLGRALFNARRYDEALGRSRQGARVARDGPPVA
jgi:hypothetical protein